MSGTSHPFGKEWAADLYSVVQPDTTFDFGAGSGTWARAFRHRFPGYWVGVEQWEPYITKYKLLDLYDKVEKVDMRIYAATFAPFSEHSLVIAGDVLEHVPMIDAEAMLERLRSCHTLVSVPVVRYDQGPIDENPGETHLWHPTHEWAMDTLRPAAHVVGDVIGAYWRTPE